ncbi:MAG: FeoB-associated Cys-rich membrane protein [Spirochaetia bacterium]|nr:FeoB-associated Cys-rich membrane protein [Spirochaetia bacterium]
MSILAIFANIIVAVIVALLLWYAIQTIRKQQKEGGCGSCGKLDEDGEPTSACRGCAFSSSCHVVQQQEEKK